jgi:predicted ATP-grasp superfamily ATP-dependent carboligase
MDRFLAALVAAVHTSGAEVVLPSDDADLMALSAGREQIPAVVPLASDEVVRCVVDKLELMRAGNAAGLSTPHTAAADEGAFETMSYPVVVKPRFHWLPEHGSGAPARLPAKVCHDRAGAVAHADAIRRHGGEPLLQEHIGGTPINIHLVADQSSNVLGLDQQESAALFYPPGAGVRVRSVTVPTNPQLASGVGRLIAASGWFGFAGVAFLRGDDGVERLIDFNGRVPAFLEASAGAGPNYLAAWAALATNRPVPELQPARPGTRAHWLEGDLRRAFRERRGGLVRDIAGSFAYSFGATHTVLKRDEPVVALRYALRQIRKSRYAAT